MSTDALGVKCKHATLELNTVEENGKLVERYVCDDCDVIVDLSTRTGVAMSTDALREAIL